MKDNADEGSKIKLLKSIDVRLEMIYGAVRGIAWMLFLWFILSILGCVVIVSNS